MWEENDSGAGAGIPGKASWPLQLGAQIPRRADCLLIPEVAFASLDSPPAGNCFTVHHITSLSLGQAWRLLSKHEAD